MAVGSRATARAEAFAAQYGAAQAHGSYAALAADPAVDAVYVATPHPQHAPACRLCLEAGKHVLCEKPLAVNAAAARAMAACARDRGVLLMEGMWTRFIPATAALRTLLQAGEIGMPALLQCDFAFAAKVDPATRLFAPELAGGALLDIGVYCVAFASMVLGTPETVAASAHLGATGVDERAAVALSYPNGAVAALLCGITVSSPQVATIIGSEGYVTVAAPFWCSEQLTVHRTGAARRGAPLPVARQRLQLRGRALHGVGTRRRHRLPDHAAGGVDQHRRDAGCRPPAASACAILSRDDRWRDIVIYRRHRRARQATRPGHPGHRHAELRAR